MKKVLLTIFAVAAVFVACDKEAVELQDPIAVEISEANASLDIDVDIEGIIGRLSNKDFSSIKGIADASRNTGSTPCAEDVRDGLTIEGSTDYLSYEIASIGGANYAIIRDEMHSPLGAFTPLVTVFFVNKGSNITDVVIGGNVVSSFTNSGFAGLYADGTVGGGFIEGLSSVYVYTGDSTVAAAGLGCIYAGQYYDVTPAPFPLNGFLATLNNVALPTGKSSANYAGTDRDAVIRAIEGDIVD